MKTKSIKIGLAQINPIVGNLENNYNNIIDKINKASKENIQLLLFPELAICGYPPKDLLLDCKFCLKCIEYVNKIAEKTAYIKTNMIVVVGTPYYFFEKKNI